VFINAYIDLNVTTYKLLWEFDHHWDNVEEETRILQTVDSDILDFYPRKHLWKGCFGGMSIIAHEYLTKVNHSYNIGKLLPHITCRNDRYHIERIIGCLLQKYEKNESVFGNIHEYCRWGITFEEKDNYTHLPWIKVWTRR
jgi:hypothetical protein